MDSLTLEVFCLLLSLSPVFSFFSRYICCSFLILTFSFLVHVSLNKSTGKPKALFPRKNYTD